MTDIGRTEESLSWARCGRQTGERAGSQWWRYSRGAGCEPDLRRLRGRMNGLAMLVAVERESRRPWRGQRSFWADSYSLRSSAWIRIVWQELLSGVEGAMEVKDEVVRTIGAGDRGVDCRRTEGRSTCT